MATIIQNVFAITKRNSCALTVSGILLLAIGVAPAQTPDAASTSAPAGPGAFGAANPAGTTAEVGDDGESSTAFEFVSPVRAVMAAPAVPANGGSPVINPAGNTLTGGTANLPTANTAVTLDVPRPVQGLSTAAKAGICTLLACGLLGLGVAGVRALLAQERSRENSLEA